MNTEGKETVTESCACGPESGHDEAKRRAGDRWNSIPPPFSACNRRRERQRAVWRDWGSSSQRRAAPLAQSTLSPDEALKELMDGNQRYIDGHGTAHEHDLELLHSKAAEGQEPFAAVLSCADCPRAGRIGLRSDDRPYLRLPRRRQYHHPGNHREPRIWRGGARHEGHHGPCPWPMRRGESDDRWRRRAGTDQRALFGHPARRRRSRTGPRCDLQGERPDITQNSCARHRPSSPVSWRKTRSRSSPASTTSAPAR